jgi:hypothetical protein
MRCALLSTSYILHVLIFALLKNGRVMWVLRVYGAVIAGLGFGLGNYALPCDLCSLGLKFI